MQNLDERALDAVLSALGQQLEAVGFEFGIVLVGGAALSLSGFVTRATNDVDVIAIAHGRHTQISPPDKLPEAFTGSVARVARDFGLEPGWLNTDVAMQWRFGLPDGFAGRVTWRSFGALRVGLASRVDLIFLKLFAAADNPGSDNRHYRDLLALRPTASELEAAASWVVTQDASPAWPSEVARVIAHVAAEPR
jgi:hypothetical protein